MTDIARATVLIAGTASGIGRLLAERAARGRRTDRADRMDEFVDWQQKPRQR